MPACLQPGLGIVSPGDRLAVSVETPPAISGFTSLSPGSPGVPRAAPNGPASSASPLPCHREGAASASPGPCTRVPLPDHPRRIARAAGGSCRSGSGNVGVAADTALPVLAGRQQAMCPPPSLLRSPAAAGRLPTHLPLVLPGPDPVDLPACSTRCPSLPDCSRAGTAHAAGLFAGGHHRAARKACCSLLLRTVYGRSARVTLASGVSACGINSTVVG